MNLPSSVVVGQLDAGKVYCDRKSVHPIRGGTPKAKNKLYCRFHTPIANFFFLVLGSKDWQFDKASRIEFSQSDYSWTKPGHMLSWPGYACPSQKEFIPEAELAFKITDMNNDGFPHVGTLTAQCVTRVMEKCKAYIVKGGYPLSTSNKDMVLSLWGSDTTDSLLSKWIKF